MNTFSMTGSTGTVFTGVIKLAGGNVGFRDLYNGSYRVRVAPIGSTPIPELSRANGWSQPEGTGNLNRHSIVVNGTAALAQAIAFAVSATTKKSASVINEAKLAAENAALVAAQAAKTYQSLAAAA